MRIVKDGAIYLGASIFEKLVPLILLPFLTRIFSTEEYGLLAIFGTVIALYGLFVGMKLDGFIRVIYHKLDGLEFSRYVSNVLALSFFLLLATILVTVLFQQEIGQISGLSNSLIILALVATSGRFIISLRLVIFQTKRQPLQYGKLQVLRPLIDLMLVSLLVFYFLWGVDGRIYSLVISIVLVAIIASWSLYRDGLLGIRLDKVCVKRAMRFVLPLLPHSMAITAFFTVDKLILSSNIGLSIVGELAIAVYLSSPTLIITESLNRTFMPWSFERFRNGELGQVVGASYVLLTLMFFVCLVYSAFLYLVFDVIVGESFSNALTPALILIWVGWIKLAYYLALKGAVYREATAFFPLISVVAGATYLGLILVNLDEIKLVDISIYMIVLHILMFVGAFILSQVKYPQPWGTLDSTKEVTKLLLNYFAKIKKTNQGS